MRTLVSVDESQAAIGSALPLPIFRPVPQGAGKSRRAKGSSLLSLVSGFSGALLEASDRSGIERALVEAAHQVFPRAMIALCGEGTNNIRVARDAGEVLTEQSRLSLCSWDNALEGAVEPAERPIFVVESNGVGAAPATLRELGLSCYLHVPLTSAKQNFGRLSLFFNDHPRLDEDRLRALNALALHASLALRNLQLEAQAIEESARLQQANDELARVHLVKSEFLSVVSHEFRTPLNIIMGYAALIEEELVGPVKDEQRRCLEQIRHASNDLLAMIMSMLQAGGLEAGLITANLESLDLALFLQRLRTEIRLPKNEDVAVRWDIPESLPVVSTDPEKLSQVLHNIVDNAIKFTDRGEVRIWSKTVPEHRQVEIKVSDTGIGIPSEVLPVVFERYRQLDGSITRAYEGLGLGLFIAKQFTELLGGTLTVVSEPGAGSTFTVTLPLSS